MFEQEYRYISRREYCYLNNSMLMSVWISIFSHKEFTVANDFAPGNLTGGNHDRDHREFGFFLSHKGFS